MTTKRQILIFLALTALTGMFLLSSCKAGKAASSVTESAEETVSSSDIASSYVSKNETEDESESAADSSSESAPETSAPTDSTKSSGSKKLSPEWVGKLKQAKKKRNTQLLIVAADGMNKSTARVSMHERGADGKWYQVFSVKGYVGKKGMIADKKRREGCQRTPIGVYRFNKAFGTAKDPGCRIPYVRVNKYHYWSGDMRKGMRYNRLVDIRKYPGLNRKKSEHLIAYKKSYRYCLNISFNEKGTPGRGSAIFLHCAGKNRYTSGCVAVPKKTMLKIMKRVKPSCVVIINTAKKLGAKK